MKKLLNTVKFLSFALIIGQAMNTIGVTCWGPVYQMKEPDSLAKYKKNI